MLIEENFGLPEENIDSPELKAVVQPATNVPVAIGSDMPRHLLGESETSNECKIKNIL